MEQPRRHRRKSQSLLGLLLSLIIGSLYLFMNPHSLTQVNQAVSPGYYKVVRDVDGDTIDVSIEGKTETVRLIGVDTPETHDPRKPVQCFGVAAANYTRGLVEGKSVRLVADPQDNNRDKYHRLLRYVYLPDGSLLNAKLIQDGYGFAYVVFPFSKLDEFRSYEQAARDQNKGLWAGCNIDGSQTIKQTSGTK